jgi:hypothetical protein
VPEHYLCLSFNNGREQAGYGVFHLTFNTSYKRGGEGDLQQPGEPRPDAADCRKRSGR